jgi:hypothetical protein
MMGNRNNLITLGAETPEQSADAMQEAPAAAAEPEDAWEQGESPARFGWVPAALALLAVAGWTGFFGWVNLAAIMAGAPPAAWAGWITDWAVPVVLIVGLWLLAMRHSRREASRFTDAAQALARESELLDRRLSTVNRELSLARDFIAAQSRDLESLGRVAAERLSGSAQHLQDLIRDNGEQVDRIGRVSTTARENMDRLRDELPVISNAARDVASQIGQAGNTAKGQVEDLVSGFNRLNEFGQASGRQVEILRRQVDEALGLFDSQITRVEEFATSRFGLLADRSAAFRADLDGREVEAFAAVRRRADALQEEVAERQRALAAEEEAALAALRERIDQLQRDHAALSTTFGESQAEAADRWTSMVEFLQQRMMTAIRQIADVDTKALENARQRLSLLSDEAARVDVAMADRLHQFTTDVEARSQSLSEREQASLDALNGRLESFDALLAARQQDHMAQVEELAARGEVMATRLAEVSLEMERIAAEGRTASTGMDHSSTLLVARLSDAGELMDQSRQSITRLTDDSVRLLELIRSSADHGAKDLPASLAAAEARLTDFRSAIEALHGMLEDTGERGAKLAADLRMVHDDSSAGLQEVIALEGRLEQIAASSRAIADRTQGELQGAIAALEQAATTQLAAMRDGQADTIRQLAEQIADDSSAAIGDAVHSHTAQAIAELREAADSAGSHGREAAAQLRDQLVKVNELTGNLERRIGHARAKAQEQVDNDFARRMALITESLNSAAIDITRAFDTDITDTAWAGYLRGDRGIFTRRAVKLLDSAAVRGIGEHYDEDREFRDSVNRYIHDFEAMLRSVLSTRDGNALAVTLLSSDMGKLYVVLAQSIDRLRD